VTPAIREKMKKAYNDCYKAVHSCMDENGRRRCDLFKDLPDKKVSYTPASNAIGIERTCNRRIQITTKSYGSQ
jgi:hypothetical protein